MDAPRTDLVRMMPSDSAQASVMQDGNTLVGFAAPFGSDTVINSWEGHFVERIAQGAFTKTLAERADKVKVLFNHGMDPSIGDKPLGKPKVMQERDGGLWTETPLSDTSYNQDIRALLNDGAIDGMSFRFSVVQDEWTKPTRKGDLPVRTLKEVRLHEFGPVTFPAYAAATAGIRSAESYRDWQNASDEQRTAIRNILGTPAPEAGSTTSETEPPVPDNEPDTDHSSSRNKQSQLRVWLLRNKEQFVVPNQ